MTVYPETEVSPQREADACLVSPWHAGFDRNFLAGLLDVLNEGVFVISADPTCEARQVLYANPRFLTMMQREAHEVIGHTLCEFFPPEDLEHLQREAWNSFDKGTHRYEFYLPRRDGAQLPVVYSTKTIETRENCSLLVYTVTDVTVQKKAQQELEEARIWLERTYAELWEQKQELERDLSLAEKVQRSMIPDIRRVGPVSMATRYIPKNGVGGDYVFVQEGDGGLYLTVCDVAGHGVAASMVANHINGQVSRLLDRGTDTPLELLQELNRTTLGILHYPVMFFTFAVVRLELQERRIEIASAGHPPVLHTAADGSLRSVTGPLPVLGVFESMPVDGEPYRAEFVSGDRVVLYSDGITEARRKGSDELFGTQRLERLLSKHHRLDVETLADRILKETDTFAEENLEDDVTLLIAGID